MTNQQDADLDAQLRLALRHLRLAHKLAAAGGARADLARVAEQLATAASDLLASLQPASDTESDSVAGAAEEDVDTDKQQLARMPPPPPAATLQAADHASDCEWQAAGAAASAQQPSVWSGFYNKTLRERSDVLALMYPRLLRLKHMQPAAPDAASSAPATGPSGLVGNLGELPLRTANLMIENCIGTIGLPLGLGLNFVIDGASLSVPMAVEEPSVVAAASSAAKLVAAAGGGFRTATTGNVMTSQIQLVGTPDVAAAARAIAADRARLLDLANATLCPNMKKRGGGAVDIYCRVVSARARAEQTARWRQHQQQLSSGGGGGSSDYWYAFADADGDEQLVSAAAGEDVEFLVVHVDVDVCEAMGANIVNTVAEGLADEVARLARCRRVGLRILTNLCVQRRARATFDIPVRKLGWKGVDGEDVAGRILDASNFAAVDPFRAVTHNKGIMNGVDAVALATGQDWRAIEAAAHCFASRSGQYTSLSRYAVVAHEETGERVLRGSMELPIAVGSKGGALQTHPGYAATHAILKHPSARELAGIMVSVGLAQNLAAVRAIAVTGIQKGHMALHARNIAVAAGAPSELVAEVCSYMLGRKSINVETAREYLQAHAVFAEIHQSRGGSGSNSSSPLGSPVAPAPVPSMFYVELVIPHLEHNVSLNIAFEAIHKRPQFIAIMPSPSSASADSASAPLTTIQRQLLGYKGYNQLEKMFLFLESLRSIVQSTVEQQLQQEDESTAMPVTQANLALQNKLQLLSILANIIAYRLMEVRPQTVRVFMQDMLGCSDGTRVRELLARVSPDDEVLAIGLPLFVALWQVLHYHIEQDVPFALLRERLVQEQRRLLQNIVRSYELSRLTDLERSSSSAALGSDESDEDRDARFLEYVAVQTKRWQATMLLLIDSVALAPDLVTPARLDFLVRVGEYMEWEGTIAHDLARFRRDMTERVPNAFLFWLAQRGVAFADVGEQHVAAFRALADALGADKWARVTADSASSWPSSAFSLPAVERVTGLIHKIYGARGSRGSRKESF